MDFFTLSTYLDVWSLWFVVEIEREGTKGKRDFWEKREISPWDVSVERAGISLLFSPNTCPREHLLHGSASLILSRARSADCDVTAIDVEWSCAPALSAHTSRPLSVTLPRLSTPVAVTRHVCPRALWPFTRFNGETSGRNTGQCRNTRLCCGLVKWSSVTRGFWCCH